MEHFCGVSTPHSQGRKHFRIFKTTKQVNLIHWNSSVTSCRIWAPFFFPQILGGSTPPGDGFGIAIERMSANLPSTRKVSQTTQFPVDGGQGKPGLVRPAQPQPAFPGLPPPPRPAFPSGLCFRVRSTTPGGGGLNCSHATSPNLASLPGGGDCGLV